MSQDLQPEKSPRKKADRKKRFRPTAHQRLLTCRQIEEAYGWPYRSVYELFTNGQLSAIRVGKRLWFERSAIEQLIERSREKHEMTA